MKRVQNSLTIAALLLVLLVPTSCVTTGNGGLGGLTPYQLGRFVTTAYLVKKGDLDPRYQEAVLIAYTAFSQIVEEDRAQESALRDLISTRATAAMGDSGAVYGPLVNEILVIYWEQLVYRYDIDSLIPEARGKTVAEFYRGVKEARDTWYSLYAPAEDEG